MRGDLCVTQFLKYTPIRKYEWGRKRKKEKSYKSLEEKYITMDRR